MYPQNMPRLSCFSEQLEGDVALLVFDGFKYALEHGTDYVVEMDADFLPSPQIYSLISGSHTRNRYDHWFPVCCGVKVKILTEALSAG